MLGFLLVVLLIPYLIAAYALLLVKLKWGLKQFGAFIVATIGLLTVMFIVEAYPIIERDGLAVFLETRWDPVRESYGVLQALTGTVLTSAVAIALAMPMALGVAVTINEILPARLRGIFGSLVDLTATMPTVIFGLWGLFVLGPFLHDVVNSVSKFLVGDEVMTSPYTLFTAGVLLAIMITPMPPFNSRPDAGGSRARGARGSAGRGPGRACAGSGGACPPAPPKCICMKEKCGFLKHSRN